MYPHGEAFEVVRTEKTDVRSVLTKLPAFLPPLMLLEYSILTFGGLTPPFTSFDRLGSS